MFKISLVGMVFFFSTLTLLSGQGIVVDSFESDFGARAKVIEKNACGFDLFASTNNSSGGIKKVGSFDYFDPNGGSAFNQDEIRISNTASTSGKIKLNTLSTTTAINTMEFRGGNNPNTIALQIIHSGMLPLQLRANGNMTIGGLLTQNSDIRLKKNIVEVNNVLSSLSEISGYRYNWNDEKRGAGKQLGLIAQEVQEMYPELVATADDGTLSVSYANFSAVLLQATKELHELVKAQAIEIENLKREVSR